MKNLHLSEVKKIEEYLKQTFYHLHRNPELGEKEYKTQEFILSQLKNMGIEAKPIADTGVLGIIRGTKAGKTVALRADMDALPIQEETGLSYQSQNPGVMHACGHDAHTTILLGTAKILQEQRNELKGNVKLFFQPAEETIGGALRMIEQGCMNNPSVDAVFFGHCTNDYPTGTVSVKSGATSASSNYFTVTFKGVGTHGAMPHKGTDVIVAASHAIIALQTICSRRTSPTDSVVVSVGSLHAGTSGNVLPETAIFSGMIRTINQDTRERVKQDFNQILTGIAQAMNVEVEIDVKDGYAATINDEEMTNLVKCSAKNVLGEENVKILSAPLLTLEDFSYFCQKAPGCYYHVGTANEEKGCINPLHNPKFVLDTEALVCGTALFIQISKNFLDKN